MMGLEPPSFFGACRVATRVGFLTGFSATVASSALTVTLCVRELEPTNVAIGFVGLDAPRMKSTERDLSIRINVPAQGTRQQASQADDSKHGQHEKYVTWRSFCDRRRCPSPVPLCIGTWK